MHNPITTAIAVIVLFWIMAQVAKTINNYETKNPFKP